MQYLSDEWIEAADRALSEAWNASEAPTDGSSTLGYTVTAAPQGKVSYHLFVGPDGAGVASGKADDVVVRHSGNNYFLHIFILSPHN